MRKPPDTSQPLSLLQERGVSALPFTPFWCSLWEQTWTGSREAAFLSIGSRWQCWERFLSSGLEADGQTCPYQNIKCTFFESWTSIARNYSTDMFARVYRHTKRFIAMLRVMANARHNLNVHHRGWWNKLSIHRKGCPATGWNLLFQKRCGQWVYCAFLFLSFLFIF